MNKRTEATITFYMWTICLLLAGESKIISPNIIFICYTLLIIANQTWRIMTDEN